MSERTAPSLAKLDDLLAALNSLSTSSTKDELIETAEALRRAVAAFHMEAIRFRMLRIVRIETHLRKEQGGDDFRCRQARRRMSRGGFGRRKHRIDSKLCGEIVENGE